MPDGAFKLRVPKQELNGSEIPRPPVDQRSSRTPQRVRLVMQENGFRHLPVMQDGKPIGIVSSRNEMDPELEEFVSEAHRRKHFGKER